MSVATILDDLRAYFVSPEKCSNFCMSRWPLILLTLGFPMMASAEPSLITVVSNSTETFSFTVLQQQLPSSSLTVYNPVYKSIMTYNGFWLEDVLSLLKTPIDKKDIVFLCIDGYGTSLSADEVGKKKWLMAYSEPKGWTPLPGHVPPEFPGPWYVIGSDQASYNKTPWPYQVVGLKIRADW